ncbi:hypothetical protein HHK36_032779 [Tetracentron sinense]|uniref:Ubiquitin-like protease family profile domain-containing protein n=1 Tax=Tetracentron sinense TaxID=13715 RepID=A0A834Y765_TETSI|nr:hypothetical protein HHK36_032779 [Tetracentron sinense]
MRKIKRREGASEIYYSSASGGEVEVQVTQAYSTPPMREAGGVQVTPMEQDEVQVTEAYVSPYNGKGGGEVRVTPAYSTSPMREGIDIYMEFWSSVVVTIPIPTPQDCSFARCWFMQLLQSDLGTLKKYSAEKDTVKRYAIADSIINGSLPRAVSGNVGERSMWTYEKIYIPFNVRGNHWILAMVKPRTREIFLLDSMYEVVEDMYTEYIDALVEGLPPLFHTTMETNELEGDESKVVVVEGLPKQPNK